MKFNRRRLFAAFAGAASAGGAVPATAREAAPSLGRAEINATALGVRPNLEVDQSAALQHAIEQAAAAGAVLHMPPGLDRAGALQLPPYAIIVGVPGSTRLVMSGALSLLSSSGSDYVQLSNLVLD